MDMYRLKQIPSEAQIRKHLRRIVFGVHLFCPQCRYTNIRAYEDRYRCPRCRVKFSLLSHTWLADMKLPLVQWWLLLWCWTSQIPVRQTMSLTRLSDKAVRHWFDQFRLHLPEEYHLLECLVQLDEAYFKDRILIMGKQAGTRKLAYQIIEGLAPDRRDAIHFLFQKVQPGSRLWTDGALIYKGIERWWPVERATDIHKRFEFTHTSEIESMFACLRTFIRRMYHHVSSEKLDDYVREFCFRFSSPEVFESPLLFLQKTLILVPTG